MSSKTDITDQTATEPLTAAQILVGTAVSQALDHGGRDATINGLLLALRHLRREVGAHGGYGAQRQLDDLLRRSLSSLHMQQEVLATEYANTYQLEAPIADRSAATVILEDAVESALVMNAVAPNSNLLDGASGALVGHLVRLADQIPQWDQVIELLDEPEAVIAERAMEDRPAARIH